MTSFFSSIDGLYTSDHFGLVAEIDLSRLAANMQQESSESVQSEGKKFEFLPLFSYDTDVGLGYGVKGFFLGFLGESESFDVILFNSTKGERWYRLVFSIPDFELRQGKQYPLSLDFIGLIMDTFVVRADLGISSEGTGFYFNFGQLF